MKKLFSFFIVLLLFNISYGRQTSAQLDSLDQSWKNEKLADTTRLKALYDLIWKGYLFSETDSALILSEVQYQFAKKRGLKKEMADACNIKGIASAIRGDLASAIEWFNQGSKLCVAIGEKRMSAVFLNNIGNLYSDQGEYKKALDYFNNSASITKQSGDKRVLANTYNNIGIIYQKMGNPEEALPYHEKSKIIFSEINDLDGLTNVFINLGYYHFTKNQFEESKVAFLKALEYSESTGNKKSQSTCNGNLAKIFIQQLNFSAAEKCGKKAFLLGTEAELLDEKKEAAWILYQCYKKSNRQAPALEMYEVFVTLRDSVEKEINKKEIIRQGFQHDFDLKHAADSIRNKEANKVKDAKIAEQNALASKRETEIKNDRNLRIALIVGIVLFGAFTIFMYNRFRLTRRQKKIIEEKKSIIERQKQLVEIKNTEIMDSINYAKRIQFSLLAHEEFLIQNLTEHFVLFLPKAIVSGDFYWCTKKGNDFYLAVCDCTGHGVPGAFMSLLNISFLNEAINEKNITEPHLILNHVRERLIQNMEGGQDGMDAILVKFQFSNTKSKIQYSAANNHPVMISNGELKELPSDKMPVGKGEKMDSFNLHELELLKGDQLYLFTDGYADQFGGPKARLNDSFGQGKKFKYSNLNKLILENSTREMKDQSYILNFEFEKWKGELEQVDDVCIIGIRF